MNLIWVIDCWRNDDEFSWNNFHFFAVKKISVAKNIRGDFTDNFLNVIVNANFFVDLKFEYYWPLPWNTAASKP